MAYERRISELTDQVKSLAKENDGPAVEALTQAIKKYADARSETLDQVVRYIDQAAIGADGLKDHWSTIVQPMKDEIDRTFGDSVKEVMLSSSLQAFWANTVETERNFFNTLSEVRTPQYVEDLLTHQGNLLQMIDKLTAIWNGLLSADHEQNEAQMQSVKQIDQIMQSIVEEVQKENQALIAEALINLKNRAAEFAAKVRERVADAVGEKPTQAAEAAIEMAKKLLRSLYSPFPGETDEQLDEYGERVKVYLEKLKVLSEGYRACAEQYRNLISAERGGVLTMFKETRRQVSEYERNNNLVTAQIMRDEAKRYLDDWADHTVMAQRDDGAEFNKKIFEIIGKIWDITEEKAKEFQERFSGVFYAPLTSDTMESLSESFLFKKAIEEGNNRGAASAIDNSRNLLTGAADEMTRMITQPLDEMDLDWSPELKEMARTSNEEFRVHMREKLKSQIDLAMNSLGELRFLIDPPKVVADFTREDLDAMLRD